jgi:opacity protein-like surface antigen
VKGTHLLGLSAAMSALLILAAAQAAAQARPGGQGPRNNFSGHSNHFSWEGAHGFNNGVFVIEREVPIIIEREVVREKPAEPPAAAPAPPPRKPYVIGSTYDSLPAGCMKMIEGGDSYYYCDGEWYQQVSGGRSATYKAVQREL